jgi:hypothetical protein
MITIKNYKDYTDEELFKLWKMINEDIEYNEKNGIDDGSEYDLYSVGIELVERKYLLDTEEHNALDYHLQESKLYDSGFYIQQDEFGRDYFVDDEDNGKKYSLKEGLEIVWDTITDNVKEYPTEILNGLKEVFKKYLDCDLEI